MTTKTPTRREATRLREAGSAVLKITDLMHGSKIPVDSCILAGEIALHTGRALGYRARIQPVRVRVTGPEGQEGRHLGYVESVGPDRYPGHVVCLWDDVVAVDVTASQMSPSLSNVKTETVHTSTLEIPGLVFGVPRSFAKGEPRSLDVNGWVLDYSPFDDGGDWARSAVADGDARRRLMEAGTWIAEQVRS